MCYLCTREMEQRSVVFIPTARLDGQSTAFIKVDGERRNWPYGWELTEFIDKTDGR